MLEWHNCLDNMIKLFPLLVFSFHRNGHRLIPSAFFHQTMTSEFIGCFRQQRQAFLMKISQIVSMCHSDYATVLCGKPQVLVYAIHPSCEFRFKKFLAPTFQSKQWTNTVWS